MFLIFIFFNIFADYECTNIQSTYLSGDYQKCVSFKSKNPQCEYYRALCFLGQNKFEEARYTLSNISTKINKDDELLYLVFNSLIEIAFLTGEYKKAVTLSKDSNKYCSNLLNYSCGINKILNIKAFYDEKDILNALKLSSYLENNCDKFFYYSIKTKWLVLVH